jgi:hypothetical protein
LKEKFETGAYRRWSSFKKCQEAATLPSTSHAEGAAIMPATSHAEGAATLPSTSHAEGVATSLLLRFHAALLFFISKILCRNFV